MSFFDALNVYRTTITELFTDPYFIAIWFMFGAINPVLRNNSVLLTSLMQNTFKKTLYLDSEAGFALMGGWITYTVGGFIAGPLITATRKYKSVLLTSVSMECVSCLIIMVGVYLKNLIVLYIGVFSQGLFLGMANTSLFEIVAEVTYPRPTMLVTMANIVGMGIFRLIYPIIGRALLSTQGAFASTCFPFAMTLASSLIIAVISPPYKRLAAQNELDETTILLEKNDENDER